MCVRELMLFYQINYNRKKYPQRRKRGWQEMKDVITVATMWESDAHTIALYVPAEN